MNNFDEQETHYVAPRKRRARTKTKMQPPMTPMIDVTFQLLLFFILTAQFRQDEGPLPGTLPKLGPSEMSYVTAPLQTVTITISPAGGLARSAAVYQCSPIHQSAITSPSQLYEVIDRHVAGLPGQAEKIPIRIHPRRDVRWEFVVEVWNVTQRARLKNVAFIYDADL